MKIVGKGKYGVKYTRLKKKSGKVTTEYCINYFETEEQQKRFYEQSKRDILNVEIRIHNR